MRPVTRVSVPRPLLVLLLSLLILLLLLAILLPLVVFFFFRSSHSCNLLSPLVTKLFSSKTPPLRLPSNHIPDKYSLSFQVFVPSINVSFSSDQYFKFNGNVTIDFECVEETDSISLHIDRLTIDEDSFQLVERASEVTVARLDKAVLHENVQLIVFKLRKKLQPGAYTLQLSFSGELSDTLEGFYRTSYIENGRMKWIAVTQFQPTHARRAFPCFDEPHLKAEFAIVITHPKHMTALSNAIEEAQTDHGNGWKTTSYKLSPKMSTYLVAIIICEFDHIQAKTERGTLFRIWSRPSMIDQGKFAAEVGPKILTYYESYFDIPFPLEKQDMVAIPDFDAGAMENWGLITYREVFLLYTPLSSSTKLRQGVAEVVAHELAHQWFGNLVTMRWWDDLWLNEGFASYLQYAGADHASDGTLLIMEQFPIRSTQQAMEPDELASTHALQVPEAHTPTEIFQMFDQITYDKGASMVRMLQFLTDENVLKNALVHYLKSNVYDVATMHNLWAVLYELNEKKPNGTIGWDGRPLDIEKLMHNWVTCPGFPVVEVTRNYRNNSVIISQRRFLLTNSSRAVPEREECSRGWYVPVWYTQKRGGEQVNLAWLEQDSHLRLRLHSAHWLLVNPAARGYYRTLYDARNWHLLTAQLLQDHTVFDVESRSQLIDDAFSLARSGKLPYATALALSGYLNKEMDFVPWETGIKVLNHLGKMYGEHEKFAIFKEYFYELIVPLFERTSMDTKLPINDVRRNRLRSLAWRFACHYEFSKCLDLAKLLYQRYMKECTSVKHKGSTECNPVPTDLRETVYCAGVSEGGAEEWAFLWDKFKVEYVAAERWSTIAGLACTNSRHNLFMLFNATIEGKHVRSSEAGLVFQNAAHARVGRNALFQYVTSNWNQLAQRFGDSSSLKMIARAATSDLKTSEQLRLLEQFTSSHKGQLMSVATDLEHQTAQATANIVWTEMYEKSIIEWIQNHLSKSHHT